MESFNQFNSKKENKPEGTQLRIDFDVEKKNISFDHKNDSFDLEEGIKKNREATEGEHKILTEEELEILKRENPVEYFAIISAINNEEEKIKTDDKEDLGQKLHTEYDLEEEIEKQMQERDNPSEEYYHRFNKNLNNDFKKNLQNNHINNNKKNTKDSYKKSKNGRHYINGPIMPFDPFK